MGSDPGVYRIVHAPSGRCYVGQTANLGGVRWKHHRQALRSGRHHSPRLQRAWDKYREDQFEWQVLERCPVEQLTEREQFWMDLLRPLLYNHCPAAGSVLGVKRSPETRARMAAAAAGNQRAAGRAMSEVNKAALRAANLGRPLSAEHRAKLAAAKIGTMNALGHRLPEETKAVIAKKLQGNRNAAGKRSPEVRARMSEAQKRRWAKS